MQVVGAFEAKTHFSALLEQVERGEHVIITKHGRQIAKLVPARDSNRQTVKQTIQRLKKFARNHTLKGLVGRLYVMKGSANEFRA